MRDAHSLGGGAAENLNEVRGALALNLLYIFAQRIADLCDALWVRVSRTSIAARRAETNSILLGPKKDVQLWRV